MTHWACPSGEAGKPFRITLGDQTLTADVPASGTWDRYMERPVGLVRLKAGEHRLVFRSAGAISGPLIDLRTIRLLPAEPTEAEPRR